MQVFTTPLSENDFVVRRRKEAAAMRYEPEAWTSEVVRVGLGPKNFMVDVAVRYSSRPDHIDVYAFAVFAENLAFKDRPEFEWQTAAKAALEKFAAMSGRVVKRGPVIEPGRPGNWLVELQGKAPANAAE